MRNVLVVNGVCKRCVDVDDVHSLYSEKGDVCAVAPQHTCWGPWTHLSRHVVPRTCHIDPHGCDCVVIVADLKQRLRSLPRVWMVVGF